MIMQAHRVLTKKQTINCCPWTLHLNTWEWILLSFYPPLFLCFLLNPFQLIAFACTIIWHRRITHVQIAPLLTKHVLLYNWNHLKSLAKLLWRIQYLPIFIYCWASPSLFKCLPVPPTWGRFHSQKHRLEIPGVCHSPAWKWKLSLRGPS